MTHQHSEREDYHDLLLQTLFVLLASALIVYGLHIYQVWQNRYDCEAGVQDPACNTYIK